MSSFQRFQAGTQSKLALLSPAIFTEQLRLPSAIPRVPRETCEQTDILDICLLVVLTLVNPDELDTEQFSFAVFVLYNHLPCCYSDSQRWFRSLRVSTLRVSFARLFMSAETSDASAAKFALSLMNTNYGRRVCYITGGYYRFRMLSCLFCCTGGGN